MKRVVGLLAVISCLVIFSCGGGENADSVLNKTVKAMGGADALNAIKTQVTTWDSKSNVPMGDSLMEMTSEMVITYKRPNMIKFEGLASGDSLVYASVYDGNTGWQYMMGQTREMSEDEMAEAETMAETWIDGPYNYKQKGMQVALLPDSTIEGKTYKVLQTTDKHGNISLTFIDPQSMLPMRMQGEGVNPETMAKEPYVMTFEDYTEHDGIMMAQKVASYDMNGNKMWEATLKDVKNNVELPEDAFSKPGPKSASDTMM